MHGKFSFIKTPFHVQKHQFMFSNMKKKEKLNAWGIFTFSNMNSCLSDFQWIEKRKKKMIRKTDSLRERERKWQCSMACASMSKEEKLLDQAGREHPHGHKHFEVYKHRRLTHCKAKTFNRCFVWRQFVRCLNAFYKRFLPFSLFAPFPIFSLVEESWKWQSKLDSLNGKDFSEREHLNTNQRRQIWTILSVTGVNLCWSLSNRSLTLSLLTSFTIFLWQDSSRETIIPGDKFLPLFSDSKTTDREDSLTY